MEYLVQLGEAQITSTGPSIDRQSKSAMSHVYVAFAFGSMSTEMASQPSASKARPTEPVPEKSSRRTGMNFLSTFALTASDDERVYSIAAARGASVLPI